VEEFGSVIICYSYCIKMSILAWMFVLINLLACIYLITD
jgi:hypothetical protein